MIMAKAYHHHKLNKKFKPQLDKDVKMITPAQGVNTLGSKATISTVNKTIMQDESTENFTLCC